MYCNTQLQHAHHMLLSVTGYHQLCLPSDLPVCSTSPGKRPTVVIIEGREEGRDRHKSHVHATTTNTASRGGGDDHRHTVWLTHHRNIHPTHTQIIAYFSDCSHPQFGTLAVCINRYCKRSGLGMSPHKRYLKQPKYHTLYH